jgi:hypothetical protein
MIGRSTVCHVSTPPLVPRQHSPDRTLSRAPCNSFSVDECALKQGGGANSDFRVSYYEAVRPSSPVSPGRPTEFFGSGAGLRTCTPAGSDRLRAAHTDSATEKQPSPPDRPQRRRKTGSGRKRREKNELDSFFLQNAKKINQNSKQVT